MTDTSTTTSTALADWNRLDAALRASWTRTRLSQLEAVAGKLSPAEREEVAQEIWAGLLGSTPTEALRERQTPTTRVAVAFVVSRLVELVSPTLAVSFAHDAWGTDLFAAHVDDATHLAWWPDDQTLILTRTVDGAPRVTVITRDGVWGRVL